MCEYVIILLLFDPLVEGFVHADRWSNECDEVLLDVIVHAQVEWCITCESFAFFC